MQELELSSILINILRNIESARESMNAHERWRLILTKVDVVDQIDCKQSLLFLLVSRTSARYTSCEERGTRAPASPIFFSFSRVSLRNAASLLVDRVLTRLSNK